MRVVIISELELIELSEWQPIELYCKHCKANTWHKPVKQIGKGRTIDMGVDEETGNQIEIEDVEDAYIVSCDTCGNYLIAKMGRTLIPPPF